MIIKQDIYDGSLIHSRFAYKFFRDKVIPTGNIVGFIAPMRVTADNMLDLEDILSKDYIYSDRAINLCYEIPCTNLWGGVAYQRLFSSIIGNILAKYLNADVEIDGDDIFVKKEFTKNGIVQLKGKASVSIVTEKQGAILGHVGININAGNEAPPFAYSTNLTDNQAEGFMKDCIEAFYDSTQSIFVATTKSL